MLLCVWFHASPVFTVNQIMRASLSAGGNLLSISQGSQWTLKSPADVAAITCVSCLAGSRRFDRNPESQCELGERQQQQQQRTRASARCLPLVP